jgi:uncharacterized protein
MAAATRCAGRNYLAYDAAGCHMELGSPQSSTHAMPHILSENRFNVSVDEKEDCRSCKWRYGCAGGCPLLALRTYGKPSASSPYCSVYKALFPRLLRLEALRLISRQQPYNR